MPSPTVVHLVPHTHWDREWYRPFQSFRMQLVELVDRVLDMLDADERFAFTLDGQLATVDDYLEIRPEGEPRLRRHVARGRLAIGPWLILMDEFLVSGETLVRNLQAGWQRAAELGGAMPLGYLPDMFGHVAQMPQILRRAGIGEAMVWRGVPSHIDHHLFDWSAPDGSTVRTHYLNSGYWSAAYLLAIPERLGDALDRFSELMRPYFGSDPLLAMYGTDHAAPLPELMAVSDELAASGHSYDVRVDTLAGYLAATDGAASGTRRSWRGEMRSSARANLLMGVTSARIELKAAAGRAEIALERYAEPLTALWLPPDAWPAPYLRLAWRRVIENSAHDSICGCSLDEVVDQVLVRYAEAEQIATGLAARAASRPAAQVARDALVVVNPSPSPRSGLIDVSLPVPDAWGELAFEDGDDRRFATQQLERSEPLVHLVEAPGRDLPAFFRRIHGRELFGRFLRGYRIGLVEGRREVTLEVDTEPGPEWLDVDVMKREIAVASAAAPDETWRLRVVATGRRRLVATLEVAPLGWSAVRLVAAPAPLDAAAAPLDATVSAGERWLDNGLLRVSVEEPGTLRLEARDGTVVTGAGRLVDGGDAGDAYNFAPPPKSDSVVEGPLAMECRQVESGPVRGIIDVVRHYRWPVGLAPGGRRRSADTVETAVAMRVELRSGERFVRLELAFDNRCNDHRLRVHVPLPRQASGSQAAGQFAVVQRATPPEAGYGEVALPTYPASGFVDAGGVAILTKQVVEYELLSGRELAVTALRATGLISRNDNPYREDPAGPQIAIPAAQGHGARRFAVAVLPHTGDWRAAGVPAAAELYRHDLVVRPGTGSRGAALPRGAAGLEVVGSGVGLSALRRVGDELELRLVRHDPEPGEATVRGPFTAAREVDLLGRDLGPLACGPGELTLAIGAWEIRTLRLR